MPSPAQSNEPLPLAELWLFERKLYSQNGEDGILNAIFEAVGVTNRVFVEFGCGDATECNTANLLAQGWTGLLMDAEGISRNHRATVHREYITAENINALLQKHGVPMAFDLLSIDIDGNDYYVWRSMVCRPRVVVIEYNAHFPPPQRRAIAYDPGFRWSGTDYFGASLQALYELGERKGYTLLYCEQNGVNAFFVSKDLLPQGFVPRPPGEIYRPPRYLNGHLVFPRDGDRVMIDPEEMAGQVGRNDNQLPETRQVPDAGDIDDLFTNWPM
jgi:hypothetical protein